VRRLRILHAPENTGANPHGLAAAEREIGLDSRSVAFHRPAFGYAVDDVLWDDDPSLPTREWRRLKLVRAALRDVDVVHFNFGLSFTSPWVPPGAEPPGETHPRLRRAYRLWSRVAEQRDLPLLRRARRGIAVTFQGDDARQGDRLASFAVNPLAELPPHYYTSAGDAHKRTRIARWDRYADRIYALNPDLLHVLPARAAFLPYANVDPRRWTVVAPSNDVPVVVHAPTHQGIKGSRFVLAALDALRERGVRFELALVEGMSRDEARRTYERADVFVDQLLLGWYGGVAVEAMALGKPVVCYVRDDDLRFVPEGMREELPIVRATPGDVELVLRRLLEAPPAERAAIGARSRAFVERWHDPLAIARRLAADYAAIAPG
jgi:glycosyltransferase involved in cell wall biosynthesis